ncbi:MAG TPA: hypothetical protein VM554_03895 [Acidisarcina sp.]|nr:hypothetical protein [Acidisarcina sp.]
MKTRLAHAVLALLAAWAVAMLTTIPFQVSVCLRNTDGDMHLFRQMIPLVVMVWSVWTFGLALLGWLLAALPITLLVNPAWIYRMRRWVVGGCVLLSVVVNVLKFEVWQLLLFRPHLPVDLRGFSLYTVFTVSYSATMAAAYAWLAGRAARRYDFHPPVYG